ncbi:hypothetical protein BGY98DRAFT_551911 [Russula aff. rugulosa BPL654]|nr:hypothetical protein BGY98DRAFT_551911 [Russula aff. rugulosa BPL654]
MPTDPVSNPPAGSIKIPATTRARGDSVSVKAENVSEARETRRHVQDSWIDAQLETVLKFNGVFIPTVTLFIIESYKWLSPDIGPQISQIPSPRPAASIVILNVLWLVSLELNITSTLFATSTLMLQWTRRYTQVPKSPRDHMHSRSYLFLCTLSVFLFLAGLVMFFFIIHKIVGIVVLIVLIAVGIFEAVYLVLLPVLTASAQSYSTISIRC